MSRTSLDLACGSPCIGVLSLIGGTSPVNMGLSAELTLSSGLVPSDTSFRVGLCSPVGNGTFSKNCHTVCNVCCCSLAVVFGKGLWCLLACPLSRYCCWPTFLLVLPDFTGFSATADGSSDGGSLGTTVTSAKSDLCRLLVWLALLLIISVSLFFIPALTCHSYS